MELGSKAPLASRDPLGLEHLDLKEPQGHRVNVVVEVNRDPLAPPAARG